MVHAERGDLAAAREHLRLAHELGDHLGLPKHPHRWRIAEARVREADGDLAGALTLLDEAERVYDLDFSPDVRPVAAMRARVWVRQGRPELALAWAADRGLSVSDEPGYLREFEHVTLARALLAGGDVSAAGFLERLLAAAEAGGRHGSVLQILVLLALAQQQQGDVETAVTTVARALELAEPEGYLATFTERGPGDGGPAERGRQSAESPRRTSPGCCDRRARVRWSNHQDRRSWSTRSANASSTCSASWRAS